MERQEITMNQNVRTRKVRFTEYYGIVKKQEEVPFLDIYVNADRCMFLDPAKLLKYDDNMSNNMQNKVTEYFRRLLKYIKEGRKKEGLKLLDCLGEAKEIHLGYAVNGFYGKAVGKIKSQYIYERLSQSKAVQSGMLKDLEESALFVKGIDKDIISDMTAMICKDELIKFTQEQCYFFNIPMEEQKIGRIWLEIGQWISVTTKLPIYNGTPIILIPKRYVTKIMTLDSRDFYRNEVLTSVQDDLMRADQGLVKILKNGEKQCIVTKKELKNSVKYRFSKELIFEEVQEKPELLRLYRNRKKYVEEDIDGIIDTGD